MALQKSKIDIPMAGVNNDTAEELLQPGSMAQVKNGEFNKTGIISKTNGFEFVATTMYNLKETENLYAIGNDGKNLLLLGAQKEGSPSSDPEKVLADGDKLFSKIPTQTTKVLAVGRADNIKHTITPATGSGRLDHVDCAVGGGYICHIQKTKEPDLSYPKVTISVQELSTGNVIYEKTSQDWAWNDSGSFEYMYHRVLYVADITGSGDEGFIILAIGNYQLQVTTWDETFLTGGSSGVGSFSAVTTTYPLQAIPFGCDVYGNAVFVAYSETGTNQVTAINLDPQTETETAAIQPATQLANGPVNCFVAEGASNDPWLFVTSWYNYLDGTSQVVYSDGDFSAHGNLPLLSTQKIAKTTLASVVGEVGTNIPYQSQIVGSNETRTASTIVNPRTRFWMTYDDPDESGYIPTLYTIAYSTAGAGVSGSNLFQRLTWVQGKSSYKWKAERVGYRIASQAWLHEGKSYVLVQYDSNTQPTIFIKSIGADLDEDQTIETNGVILKNLASQASVVAPGSNIINDIAYVALKKTERITTNTTVDELNANTSIIDEQSGGVLATIDMMANKARIKNIESDTYITGSILKAYDGSNVYEAGFNLNPPRPSYDISDEDNQIKDTGFLANNSVYQTCAIYTYTDNQGRLWRSAPSVPLAFETPESGAQATKATAKSRITQKIYCPGQTPFLNWYPDHKVPNTSITGGYRFTVNASDQVVFRWGSPGSYTSWTLTFPAGTTVYNSTTLAAYVNAQIAASPHVGNIAALYDSNSQWHGVKIRLTSAFVGVEAYQLWVLYEASSLNQRPCDGLISPYYLGDSQVEHQTNLASRFFVQFDVGGTQTVTIPEGHYTQEDLATLVNSAMSNGALFTYTMDEEDRKALGIRSNTAGATSSITFPPTGTLNTRGYLGPLDIATYFGGFSFTGVAAVLDDRWGIKVKLQQPNESYFTKLARTTIELYRTTANGNVFYKEQSIRADDQNYDILTNIGTIGDEDIISKEILYTSGGVLENDGPPATHIITVSNNRFWLVPDDDLKTIWYSKKLKQGLGVEFSAFQVETIRDGGNITSIANMDDNLIVFKETAIFAISGEGPNVLGQGQFYINRIASDVGCTDAESVALTPLGLTFKSKKGLYLLDRSRQIANIGAAVKDYDSYNVVDTILHPEKEQILFSLSSGDALLYDYHYNAWTIREGLDADNITSLNNLLYITQTDNKNYYKESTIKAISTTDYSLDITTPWIKLTGLQGFQRLWWIHVLARYITSHTINIEVYYDYSSTASETITKSFTSDPGVEQVRFKPSLQKCEAFRLRIYDSDQASTKDSFSLVGISCEVGLKKTNKKLSSSNTL